MDFSEINVETLVHYPSPYIGLIYLVGLFLVLWGFFLVIKAWRFKKRFQKPVITILIGIFMFFIPIIYEIFFEIFVYKN